MKKLRTLFVTAVVAIIVALCFTGCGGVEGKYKLSSMKVKTIGDATVVLNVGDTYMGLITLEADTITLELKSDGTCISTSNLAGETMTTGTWKRNEEDSKKLDLTFDGETQTVTCDGSTLVIEMEGATATLKK